MPTIDNVIVSNQALKRTYASDFEPIYKYVKTSMANAQSTTVTLTATGQTEVSFKIPHNSVFNLSRSRLAGTLNINAQSGTTKSVIHADTLPFQCSIYLQTANSLNLSESTQAAKYMRIANKLHTKVTDFLTNDDVGFCYPSNSTSNATANGTAQTVAYLESQYLEQSADDTAMARTFEVDVGVCTPDTLCALDTDITIGQNDVYLKLVIDGFDKWTWNSGGGTLNNTPAVTISNCYLYMAVEQNDNLKSKVLSDFQSGGLKISTPFLLYNAQPLTGTSQNMIVTYLPNNGKVMRKIMHTVWNNTDTYENSMNCLNTGSYITTYNTYLDDKKMQDDVVSNDDYSAWRLNRIHCKDTPIFNQGVYEKTWFHIENLESAIGAKEYNETVPRKNIVSGLPLEKALSYQFQSTSSGAGTYNHIVWAVVQRDLVIAPNDIVFV